jgi:hypothetical protein
MGIAMDYVDNDSLFTEMNKSILTLLNLKPLLNGVVQKISKEDQKLKYSCMMKWHEQLQKIDTPTRTQAAKAVLNYVEQQKIVV